MKSIASTAYRLQLIVGIAGLSNRLETLSGSSPPSNESVSQTAPHVKRGLNNPNKDTVSCSRYVASFFFEETSSKKDDVCHMTDTVWNVVPMFLFSSGLFMPFEKIESSSRAYINISGLVLSPMCFIKFMI